MEISCNLRESRLLFLDNQRDFDTLSGNPQQILAYSWWYIFKSFIKSFFKSKIPLGYPKMLMIVSLIII